MNGQALASQGARQLINRGLGGTDQFGQQREKRGRRQVGWQGLCECRRVAVVDPQEPLLALPLRVAGKVDDGVPQAPAGELLLPGQARQDIADRAAQQGGKFIGGGSGGGVADQSKEGVGEGAVAGEADGTVEPQALRGKAWPVGQGVVAGVVVETAEAAERFQTSADGDRGERERRADLCQGKDGAGLAEIADTGLPRGECHG